MTLGRYIYPLGPHFIPNMTDKPTLIENHLVRVDGPNEKDLIFKNFQEIPDWWLQSLRDQEAAQKHKRPEMRRIASIPEAVVHAWAKEGFILSEQTPQAIHARLIKEDMGKFITGLP